MAGHSKWANIKHRKAAQDKKRGKLWSKCSKAIMAAARNGGADPDTNLALRYAIDEAKYANMPKDTIQRAIDKGAGTAGGDNFQEVTYEGYGPSGVAIIADGITDNLTRTVGEVRAIFKKIGGSLGQSGSVAFQFETRGRILIPAKGVSEDALMELALDAGASDVQAPQGATDDEPGFWTVDCDPAAFIQVKDAIERAEFAIEEAGIAKIPTNTVEIGAEDAQKLMNLIDALEDNDDVQHVYHNADISDEVAATLG